MDRMAALAFDDFKAQVNLRYAKWPHEGWYFPLECYGR